MDIRTWQEAGIRAGSYSARHRARSPFSPLRPAPIAIGSLSTAAIAAFAFVGPGILHGSSAVGSTTLLDGAPNRVAPLAQGTTSDGEPGFVSVTAPSSPATSDAPAVPASTATSSAVPTSSRTHPAHPPTLSTSSPPSTQPPPSRTLPTTPSPTTPTPPPTPPPTTPTPPVTPTPTPTPTPPVKTAPTNFDSSAAVSSALDEIRHARDRQGLDGLSVDRLLAKAALLHSADMARTGDFSHIGSDGSDPYSRAAHVGCYSLSQELIAHGKPGDDVIGAMIRDPASRRALLAFWTGSIGVSAQLDPTTGDVYWTVELGW